MSWHAVRAVVDAAASTRSFLQPDERGRWLRLSALTLFVGVGWLVPAVVGLTVPAGVATPIAASLALTAAIAAVADAYGRFTLVSGLRTGRLRPNEDVRWRLNRSIRWLGFAFGVGVLLTAATGVALRAIHGGWLALTDGSVLAPVDAGITALAALSVAVVLIGALGVAHATLSLLPATMLATGVGAVASWRRLWHAFAGYRGGFVGYLLVRGLVGAGVAGLALLAMATITAALAVVAFVTLVALFGTVSAAMTTVGVVPFAAASALAALAFAVLPVRAAATVYLTSYDLGVLGAVEEDLALLEGVRAGPSTVDAGDVVLPDGTRVGAGATDGGLGDTDEPSTSEEAAVADTETGGFQFGDVDAVDDET